MNVIEIRKPEPAPKPELADADSYHNFKAYIKVAKAALSNAKHYCLYEGQLYATVDKAQEHLDTLQFMD